MYLAAEQSWTWPEAMIVIGVIAAAIFLIGGGMATFIEMRKQKLSIGQQEAIQQIVRRYEQLAETTLDAQQRIAADMSELRTRAMSIEKILRSVE
jgi:hypothetical protein